MGDCEPQKTANTMIKFILSLTPKQREVMKRKIKNVRLVIPSSRVASSILQLFRVITLTTQLIWVPDKRPHLESNKWVVRQRFHLPQLPFQPSHCPFSQETWWALSTLACIEGPDVLIPYRNPQHLLQRIMDSQKYVDTRDGWEQDTVEWTWTVDFDQGTMTGQKRDHLGWRYEFGHLAVGCLDKGLQTFPVGDFGHFVRDHEVERRKNEGKAEYICAGGVATSSK